MQTQQIQERIAQYTTSLPQAVQGGNAAQFAFLLSLIASNQEMPGFDLPQTPQAAFELPQQEVRYPDVYELHTPEVVERMNTGINRAARGELAYAISHVDTLAERPRLTTPANDNLAKLGLQSAGYLLLDEIDRAGQQLSVSA